MVFVSFYRIFANVFYNLGLCDKNHQLFAYGPPYQKSCLIIHGIMANVKILWYDEFGTICPEVCAKKNPHNYEVIIYEKDRHYA